MATKFFTYFFLVFSFYLLKAQTTVLTGPLGSGYFGSRVTVLPNGNYVITDPYYDEGGTANVGAVYLYNGATHTLISTLKGSNVDDYVGYRGITVLNNGNYVVYSQTWNNGAGAVTWCNATTGINGVVSSSNSLVGSTATDLIGGEDIVKLSNGNYVVYSSSWDNGAIENAGAVTWCNGSTGRTGVVSVANSLVGDKTDDLVGTNGVVALTNGNYIVCSSLWNNGSATNAGAVTWCNGTTGYAGIVSSSNSLVGSITDDNVGYSGGANKGVKALSNGNYVVCSGSWDNGAIANVGAATWCNGTTGRTGTINSSNSLIGTAANDKVGIGSCIPLNNGHYVVGSSHWNNGAVTKVGAVTWCNGTTGRTGTVSVGNSLVGTTTEDYIGTITALTNGNYVVSSSYWNRGAISDAGAVTWCNGTTGRVGTVSTANSLVGSQTNDYVGLTAITPLSNGNYVVGSHYWRNGTLYGAGAVTWGNGTTGTVGTVSSANSLVGSSVTDNVGDVVALPNGNYVAVSDGWNNGAIVSAGAVTWGNGTTGISGVINSSNSLVGTNANDGVGHAGVFVLSNSNYVVATYYWNGLRGAVTWCNGTIGRTGAVSSANSLVGSTPNDYVGSQVIVLTDGNYITSTDDWDNGVITNAGAATWCSGTTGRTGTINGGNSLIGIATDQNVGAYLKAFGSGYYGIHSGYWENGAILNTGAATWGKNSVNGTIGTISGCNSVFGSIANAGYTFNITYNAVYTYMIVSMSSENKVKIYNPTGQNIAEHLDNQTQNISGVGMPIAIKESNCRLIATLTPNGASPISGSTTAKAWIDAIQTPQLVKRHYEITPAANANAATSKLTIYFTQQEFDDFNAVNSIDLPTNPADATGKANLLIEKRSGTSSDGSGNIATYGASTTIDPVDVDIVWDAAKNCWAVSFDVTGFSGFWVKTQSTPLPVELHSFTATHQEMQNLLSWTTVSEMNNQGFEVQKSADRLNFEVLGFVEGKNNSTETNFYAFTDKQPYPITYYRLKQIDIDGNFHYSPIISLATTTNEITFAAYPNPSTGIFTLEGEWNEDKVILFDVMQKTHQVPIHDKQINISHLPIGVYLLRIPAQKQVIKLIKQ